MSKVYFNCNRNGLLSAFGCFESKCCKLPLCAQSSGDLNVLVNCHMPGGVLPIMAYTGRLRPKGVPFFRLQVYKRVGISQV